MWIIFICINIKSGVWRCTRQTSWCGPYIIALYHRIRMSNMRELHNTFIVVKNLYRYSKCQVLILWYNVFSKEAEAISIFFLFENIHQSISKIRRIRLFNFTARIDTIYKQWDSSIFFFQILPSNSLFSLVRDKTPSFFLFVLIVRVVETILSFFSILVWWSIYTYYTYSLRTTRKQYI